MLTRLQAAIAAEAQDVTDVTAQFDSVAAAFPYEIVEAILLHLSGPDIMVAASHVPKKWRMTIEHSKKRGRQIVYHWDDNLDYQVWMAANYKEQKVAVEQAFLSIQKHRPKVFTIEFEERDLLFCRRPDGADCYILAQSLYLPNRQPLQVLDSTKKVVRRTPGSRYEYVFVDLYDFHGHLVFSKQVGQRRKRRIRWDVKIAQQ